MAHKLPLGRADFESIRKEGFLYVDKTGRMYEMIGTRKFVFLSRPRRFGKSLLLNTLDSYFSGKKDLFNGLKISELEHDWIEYPVIRLDMSSIKDAPVEKLSGSIGWQLEQYEKEYSIPANDSFSNGTRFNRIIRTAKALKGQNVVVLIDEYDAPLNAHLHDGRLKEVKTILQDVYQQLKVCEKDERFVFITGISRFSQVSVFSTLNNLTQISMSDQFSDICGITRDELLSYFKEDIEKLAKNYKCTFDEMLAKLEYKYDGYHFSKNSPGMFNPTSLLAAFDSGEIGNYWFGTATSSYIIDHLKTHHANIPKLAPKSLLGSDFDISPEEDHSLWPLLFQAGYLTIKGYDPEWEMYLLDYPNNEVRIGMMENMMTYYFPQNISSGKVSMIDFYGSLKRGQVDEAMEYLRDFLSEIPNILNNKEEKHFQTILYVMFTWIGFYTETEVCTAVGRMDVVIKNPKQIFVIELKVDDSAQNALNQINSKNYPIAYKHDGREIIKIGINIATVNNVRTVESWAVERG